MNESARAAVDQHVLDQADLPGSDIRKGIIMEMAEPWASVPSVMDAAREQVRSKADELLNRQPPPGRVYSGATSAADPR